MLFWIHQVSCPSPSSHRLALPRPPISGSAGITDTKATASDVYMGPWGMNTGSQALHSKCFYPLHLPSPSPDLLDPMHQQEKQESGIKTGMMAISKHRKGCEERSLIGQVEGATAAGTKGPWGQGCSKQRKGQEGGTRCNPGTEAL